MNCPIERLKRVESYSLNTATGERGAAAVEWRTEPCGAPLFGDDAKAGICRSCASGWAVEGNGPTETGRAQIGALCDPAGLRTAGGHPIVASVPDYARPIWEGEGNARRVANKDHGLPLWSGKGEPPAIGAHIEIAGPRDLTATVLGYFVDAGWLMVWAERHSDRKQGDLAGAEIRQGDA